jgi:DNA-binding transcriptional MerR regulator
VTGPELAKHAGITYRQLDFWVRAGYVTPTGGEGTGHARDFSWVQCQMVAWMARLVKAGFKPAAAAELVRSGEAREKAAQALLSGWLEKSA